MTHFVRVFARLDPDQFGYYIGKWMTGACEAAGLRYIAIDGNACRSAPRDTLSGCLHLVRRMAASLLKQNPGKVSIKAKKLGAALDARDLEQDLRGFKAN